MCEANLLAPHCSEVFSRSTKLHTYIGNHKAGVLGGHNYLIPSKSEERMSLVLLLGSFLTASVNLSLKV